MGEMHMNKIGMLLDHNAMRQGGTAASSFHLSETLDWSSLSAQIKNRTVVLPVIVGVLPEVEPPNLIEPTESPTQPADPEGKPFHS